MTYAGLIKGSRTLDYAALLAIFGAIQTGLPMVQDSLQGYYGYIFMAVGAIVGVLRIKTSEPIK